MLATHPVSPSGQDSRSVRRVPNGTLKAPVMDWVQGWTDSPFRPPENHPPCRSGNAFRNSHDAHTVTVLFLDGSSHVWGKSILQHDGTQRLFQSAS